MFRDGSLAHLPWLQEMPDLLTTAMWSTWVEINPQDGANGWVSGKATCWRSLRSTESCSAPVMLSPGIAPDVDRHAHRARAPEFRPLCQRPRRESDLDSRADDRIGNRLAGLGRNARQDSRDPARPSKAS